MFGAWRVQARARLRRLPRSQVRLIRYLAPPAGDFPDFLTPFQTEPELGAGVAAVLSTPERRLRRDLAVLTDPPGWARPLADADRAARARSS